MKIKTGLSIFKRSAIEFAQVDSLMHGAALAFYAMLAMVPVLYLSITYFGKIVGHDYMVKIISDVLTDYIGIRDVTGILEFLDGVDLTESNPFLQLLGIIALLFSASTLMQSLKRSITVFYRVQKVELPRFRMILRVIVSRLVSLLFIVCTTIIIIGLYFIETIYLSLDSTFLENMTKLHWALSELIRHGSPIVLNFIAFMFIFKYLHDGVVSWKMVFWGSVFTSVFLYLGQILIKFYITKFFFASGAGLGGAFLVILVWVYYSSQIIFFGAKYIAVRAEFFHTPILPRD